MVGMEMREDLVLASTIIASVLGAGPG